MVVDIRHLKLMQEVILLRGEIKKMGTEGVKLLQQREKEINDMRSHLKNVLQVLESRAKVITYHLLATPSMGDQSQGKYVSPTRYFKYWRAQPR